MRQFAAATISENQGRAHSCCQIVLGTCAESGAILCAKIPRYRCDQLRKLGEVPRRMPAASSRIR